MFFCRKIIWQPSHYPLKPKHLEIHIEDELGKRKVVDTYYESSMKIRKPYKISGNARISIYEDGQRVKHQEIK